MSYDKRLLTKDKKVILLDLDNTILAFDEHFIKYATEQEYPDALIDFKRAKEPNSKYRFDKWLTIFGHEFWATMPWAVWGRDFYSYCVSLCPTVICTSPTNDPSCAYGKHLWINQNIKNRNWSIIPCKWAFASPNHLLIDDTHKKVDHFIKSGGNAILFNSSRLEEIKQEIKLFAAA